MVRRELCLVYASLTSALAATSFVGYEGCSQGQTDTINGAYAGAKSIFDIVRDANIDFSKIVAGDFLGPQKWNQGFQDQIQSIIHDVASLNGGTPAQSFSINVRCDDRSNVCSDGKTYAYTKQISGGYDHGSINFCPKWFSQSSLDDAVNAGRRSTDWNYKYNMENYQNAREVTLIHEFLHIDWVIGADPYGSRSSVIDYDIQFYDDNQSGKKVTRTVYGARLAKILATWFDSSQQKPSIGRIIATSDENMTMYMLAAYLITQLGTYPHLPMMNASPPRGKPLPSTPLVDDPFYFNATGGIVANDNFNTNSVGYPDPDYSAEERAPVNVTIDKFIDLVDYDKDYVDAYNIRINPMTKASNFHNQLHDGWITVRTMAQSDIVTQDLECKADGSYTVVFDGWLNYWSADCPNQVASFMWPMEYGDVYLQSDGYLHDAGGNQIGTIKIDC
ncbi:hypothetical protein BDV96DRAFT_17027 [Lophiotrema nucula]|uniref:Lysine-specific metallo-endopeptidase domain-containing protein n=1 Tax=Lophiotrema nucula TaxID=690887 RepID=A0A6A5ZDK8_9PLEO|nr:hypothetical protein BDV96DRAFT_17027 [Lophiotrema nucula]